FPVALLRFPVALRSVPHACRKLRVGKVCGRRLPPAAAALVARCKRGKIAGQQDRRRKRAAPRRSDAPCSRPPRRGMASFPWVTTAFPWVTAAVLAGRPDPDGD